MEIFRIVLLLYWVCGIAWGGWDVNISLLLFGAEARSDLMHEARAVTEPQLQPEHWFAVPAE